MQELYEALCAFKWHVGRHLNYINISATEFILKNCINFSNPKLFNLSLPGEEVHDPLCWRAPHLLHTLSVPLQLHQRDRQRWSAHLHPLPGTYQGINVLK